MAQASSSENDTEMSITVERRAFQALTKDRVTLRGNLWMPRQKIASNDPKQRYNLIPLPSKYNHYPLLLFVHQYSVMGGCAELMEGMARHMSILHKFPCVTFDMRGVNESSGKATLTGVSEIEDVKAVIEYIINEYKDPNEDINNQNSNNITDLNIQNTHNSANTANSNNNANNSYITDEKGGDSVDSKNSDKSEKILSYGGLRRPIIIIGSSGGAPIGGSAMGFENYSFKNMVLGGIFIGYTYGWMASIMFSKHYNAIKGSSLPKLFIMGNKDGFTSVSQLDALIKKCNGDINDKIIIDGKGHFEIEQPTYDRWMTDTFNEWIHKNIINNNEAKLIQLINELNAKK